MTKCQNCVCERENYKLIDLGDGVLASAHLDENGDWHGKCPYCNCVTPQAEKKTG